MIELANPSENLEKRRAPVVAGIFYPETEAKIRAALQKYFSMVTESDSETARKQESRTPLALIVPHAAWEITGPLLAEAFELVKGRSIKQVVLLGPLHEWHEEGIFLSDSAVFETPLGDLPVNLDKIDEILSCTTALELNDIPHLSEHSLEVLLPWIYTTCPGASIVPILIGAYKPSHIHSLTRALELTFGDELETTLFVVTTNLSSHYDDTEAFEQSRLFLELLLRRDGATILSEVLNHRISACGAAAVSAFLDCNFASLTDTEHQNQPAVSSLPRLLGQASARPGAGKAAAGLIEEPDKSVHYAALYVPMP